MASETPSIEAIAENFEKKLRSVLISAQAGRSARELELEYKEMFGKFPPFRELGYPSTDVLLQSLEGKVLRAKGCTNRRGEWLFEALATAETVHIQRNVQQQRKNKTSSIGGLRQATRGRGRGRGTRGRGGANVNRGRGGAAAFQPRITSRSRPFDNPYSPAVQQNQISHVYGGSGNSRGGNPTFLTPRFSKASTSSSAMSQQQASANFFDDSLSPFFQTSFSSTNQGSVLTNITCAAPWQGDVVDSTAVRDLPYQKFTHGYTTGAQANSIFDFSSNNELPIRPYLNQDSAPSDSRITSNDFLTYQSVATQLSMGIKSESESIPGAFYQKSNATGFSQPYSVGQYRNPAVLQSDPSFIRSQNQLVDCNPSGGPILVDEPKMPATTVCTSNRAPKEPEKKMPRAVPEQAPMAPPVSVPTQNKRRLPFTVGKFAEEVKEMLVDKYPDAILVTDLGKAYCAKYGDDFDTDPEKYYCKSWRVLCTGLFSIFCDIEGEGLKMRVKCKTNVVRQILERPKDEFMAPQSSQRNPEQKQSAGNVPKTVAIPIISGVSVSRPSDRSQKEERLRRICRQFIGVSGIDMMQLIDRIKLLAEGNQLLDELNIWDMTDLIPLLSDMDFNRETRVISLKSQSVVAMSTLEDKMKRAYEYALTLPNRRVSTGHLQEAFGIPRGQVSSMLSTYKGYFLVKISNDGQLELEAIAKEPTLECRATVNDSYEMESFNIRDNPEQQYVSVGLCDTSEDAAKLSQFYVKIADNADALENLLEKMRSFYSTMDELKSMMYSISPGDIEVKLPCALISVCDSQRKCYRVVIEQPNAKEQTKVDVRFVDHGRLATVPMSYLKYIPQEFVREVKAQAIPCSLAGLESWEQEGNKELVKFFELSGSGTVWAYVEDYLPEEDKYLVHLCINEGDGEEDTRFLAEELIKRGLATGWSEDKEDEPDLMLDYAEEDSHLPNRGKLDLDDPKSGVPRTSQQQLSWEANNLLSDHMLYRTPEEQSDSDDFKWGSDEEAEIERELLEALNRSKERVRITMNEEESLLGAVGGISIVPPPGFGTLPHPEVQVAAVTANTNTSFRAPAPPVAVNLSAEGANEAEYSAIRQTIQCLRERKQYICEKTSNCGSIELDELLDEAMDLDRRILDLAEKLPPTDPQDSQRH